MFLPKLKVRGSGEESEKALTKVQLFERSFDDDARKEAVQVLQTIANQDSLVKPETGDSKFEKYVATLVGLGFVRGVATLEGKSYEITETGSRFLEEYRQVERDRGSGLRIEPDRVLDGIIKG